MTGKITTYYPPIEERRCDDSVEQETKVLVQPKKEQFSVNNAFHKLFDDLIYVESSFSFNAMSPVKVWDIRRASEPLKTINIAAACSANPCRWNDFDTRSFWQTKTIVVCFSSHLYANLG
ncbi:MAG: hypothetical protein FJZ56_04195 [Chlamydiae bacterium]|nr:hypothetical protein [Chlamydiota bacterium]